jgi:hypothetical protein
MDAKQLWALWEQKRYAEGLAASDVALAQAPDDAELWDARDAAHGT